MKTGRFVKSVISLLTIVNAAKVVAIYALVTVEHCIAPYASLNL